MLTKTSTTELTPGFFYSTSASLPVLLRAEPFSHKKRKRCPALAFSTLSLLENAHVFSQLDEIRRVLGPPGKRFFLGRDWQRQMATPFCFVLSHMWHDYPRLLQQRITHTDTCVKPPASCSSQETLWPLLFLGWRKESIWAWSHFHLSVLFLPATGILTEAPCSRHHSMTLGAYHYPAS